MLLVFYRAPLSTAIDNFTLSALFLPPFCDQGVSDFGSSLCVAVIRMRKAGHSAKTSIQYITPYGGASGT